ncbi:Tripartite ATP-independent transporter DctM subunit [Paraburkholderia unamae]|uniref:TRAP transporter large permease n=1 Tax=Paraburkholderia unamae TaxID=219649 RepID=UPI001CB0B026|nr:TRAP transporter large permease subunit [Paraburkholderia unamae]CAG9268968.1 Tripartite ATP-independent transporter DctM subunit [Paraburkholderia unamae]
MTDQALHPAEAADPLDAAAALAAKSAWRRALRGFDRALVGLVEVCAAALLAVEIVVLLAGVISRYAFHAPFVWSDELTGILFMWLAMLGAVLALRRGEHMRMTAFVGRLSPRARAFVDTFAICASIAFLALLLQPAYDFASGELPILTPALQISDAWRAGALPIGAALMLIVGLIRLAQVGRARDVLVMAALAVAIGVLAVQAAPWLQTLGKLNLVIFFVGVVAIGIFSGVPIGFSFALATFGYLSLTTFTPMEVMVGRMDEGMSHLVLLAVPLFVFLGLLIEMTGMARAMIEFLAGLVGHLHGGLSYVLIGAMYLVSGISGSKVADMAAIAPVLFPEMKKRGANEGDLVALLATTGAQSETIPPSIVLITIGSVTGLSISALFTAGMLPAALLAAILCTVVWWRYRKEDLSGAQRFSRREIGRMLVIAAPALALPFVIRAAVVEGVATATEVSTIGIAYTMTIGLLVYRRFEWRRLGRMLVDAATLSGAILFIIGCATAMAWALTQSGFSQDLAQWMGAMPGGSYGFLAVSIVVFTLLGSVLEGIPAIVLFGPLLFPIARMAGVNEVHYAIVVILSMGLGLFSPPFGVGYYSACAISKVNPDAGIRPIVGYMCALFVGLVLIAAIPWISTGFL